MTAVRVTRDQVLRYRLRAQQLAVKVRRDEIGRAAWGGLQDSAPRSGVLSLHARVQDARPDDWEHPDLAQIWFRGGADYLIPRGDIGVFTLGSLPRDQAQCARLEAIAGDAVRILDGDVLKVREVVERMTLDHPTELKNASRTGRVLIRWNASMIWLIANERPAIDAEDARLELARRFLHWYGPQTRERFAWWAAIAPSDAKMTWAALAGELADVEIGAPKTRSMLERDLDALTGAGPVEGVRLLPFDDAFTKHDRDLLVADTEHRSHVFPPVGTSRGYIPGAVVVDGEICGVWQRRQRKVTVYPWRRLRSDAVEAVEAEALAFPISSSSKPSILWV